MRQEQLLDFGRLTSLSHAQLAPLIRASGYYNQKSRRLQEFGRRLHNDFGSLKRLAALPTGELRQWLLAVNGIGKETADSILLYAFQRPVFVVDAYTTRIFSRHAMVAHQATYDQIQDYLHANLQPRARIYNEFHALLVRVGKDYCKKRQPACAACPLDTLLPREEV